MLSLLMGFKLMNHIIPSVNESRNAKHTALFSTAGRAALLFLRRTKLWLGALVLVIAGGTSAQASFSVIPANTSADFGFSGTSYGSASQTSFSVVTYDGTNLSTLPNQQGWEINITSQSPLGYNVKLCASNTAAVQAGDLIVATFYYRRKDGASGGEANFTCDFQSITSPYTQSFNLPLRGRAYPANSVPPNGNPVTATDTVWRRVSIPFTSSASYAAGAAQFNFYMGAAGLQVLDIAGVTLTDYPQTSVYLNATPPPTNPIDSSSYFTSVSTGGTITRNVAISGLALYTTGTQIQTTSAPTQTWPNPPVTWNLRLDNRLPVATNVGDTLVALFWIKATALPTQPNGTVPPYAVAGITATGCAGGSFNLMVDPKAGWREYMIPLKVMTAEPIGNTDFYINFGFQLQTVQVAGIQLMNLGQALGGTGTKCTLTNQAFDYPGRAITDGWRTTAATNIAKYREGTLTVNVHDGNGNSISGVTVNAAMTAPLFGFGCQTSSTPIIGWNDNGNVDQNGLNLFYQLFNHVEYGCYKWGEWEEETLGSPLEYCTPSYNAEMLDTIHSKGIFDFRGHNLIWPADGLCPSDVASITTASAMTARINGHITQMVGDPTVHGFFNSWDAINEPYDHNDEMQVENGLPRHTGGETQPPGTASATQAQNDANAIAPWLAFIRATDPNPHLFINDWGMETNTNHIDTSHEDYDANLMTDLENLNANLDGVGFESHFVDSFTPPLVLTNLFNRFGSGLASGHSLIENVTEFDETESSGMATAFPPDIDLYTDYMNDYLTEVFSQPNFDFFDLWGLGDLYNAYSNGTTNTYYLMPPGEAWMSLVRNQWWTNTSAASSTSGVATLPNCFLGRYCLTATNGSITKKFYTDVLNNTVSTLGNTTTLQLSGSTGTTHVWTYAASRRSNAIEPPFQVYTDSTAYNGQYIMAPTTGTSLAPVPNGQLPEMRIDTEATGSVSLWLHVSTLNGNQDSFWMQFAGANPGTTVGTADPNAAANGHSPTGPFSPPATVNYVYVPLDDNATWHWVKVNPAGLIPANLVAGKNSLYIVHRETGAKLDEVLITDDPNFTPK
jgi:GH35 family endo-1,4-beta-xylanase